MNKTLGGKVCVQCNNTWNVCKCDLGQIAISVNESTSLNIPMQALTLPTDSQARKGFPVYSGCLKYFPAALAGVAQVSKAGNDKHNPGETLHHARGKSMDHSDCVVRHLMDVEDLLASIERGAQVKSEQVLNEANQMVWRALAYSQELHERFGAPLAPGAKK